MSRTQQLLSIYRQRPLTFFCEHPFEASGFTKIKYCDNCPAQVSKIQWMMIVSAKQLVGNQLCYQEKICTDSKGERFKGMRCCRQLNPQLQVMLRDLHNWVPELPIFIQKRHHAQFGMVNVHEPANACELYFDRKHKLVEPPPAVRGFIARTYLYMSDRYHLPINNKEYQQYLNWHRQYPVTGWEKERNEKIRTLQGHANPYISR